MAVGLTHPSLPGLTRQSIHLHKNLLQGKMDARVISAFTRVFDALLPAHDGSRTGRKGDKSACVAFFPLTRVTRIFQKIAFTKAAPDGPGGTPLGNFCFAGGVPPA
jgi:hypothetical protein